MTQLSNEVNQIIVTRPFGQADSLINQLKAAVAEKIVVNHLPLIQINSLPFDPPETDRLDGVIFISSNAVSVYFAHATLPQVPLFAVGNNSASELQHRSGQAVKFPTQMNSEGLLKLPELTQVENQSWLIVKGEGGRKTLYDTLTSRGASVMELDVYQRKLPDFNTQQAIYEAQFNNPVWLVTSADALNHLFRILGLMEKKKHQTPVIVSSERLATLAKQKGFTILAQSAGASETQLVQCVKTRFNC